MRRWMALAVILAAFLTHTPALAADPTCTVQDYSKVTPKPNFNCPGPLEETMVPSPVVGPKESVVLDAKAPAPWAGILLDRERVLELGLRITGLRKIRWSEGLEATEKAKAEVKLTLDNLTAEVKLTQSQRESYKTQLVVTQEELAKEKKWYRSWTFGLIVGVVTTSAAAITLAYVARK